MVEDKVIFKNFTFNGTLYVVLENRQLTISALPTETYLVYGIPFKDKVIFKNSPSIVHSTLSLERVKKNRQLTISAT